MPISSPSAVVEDNFWADVLLDCSKRQDLDMSASYSARQLLEQSYEDDVDVDDDDDICEILDAIDDTDDESLLRISDDNDESSSSSSSSSSEDRDSNADQEEDDLDVRYAMLEEASEDESYCDEGNLCQGEKSRGGGFRPNEPQEEKEGDYQKQVSNEVRQSEEDDSETSFDDGDTLTTSCSTASKRCDYDVNPTSLFQAIAEQQWAELLESQWRNAKGKTFWNRLSLTSTSNHEPQVDFGVEARTWVIKYRDDVTASGGSGLVKGLLRSCLSAGLTPSGHVGLINAGDELDESEKSNHERSHAHDDDTASLRSLRRSVIQWQQLPLHQALIQGAPYEVVEMLTNLYPRAASLATEPSGMLPLHLALANDANDDVVRLITSHHPGSIGIVDHQGFLPTQLARRRMDRALLLQCLTDHVTNNLNHRQENSRTVWNRQLRLKEERCHELSEQVSRAEAELDEVKAEAEILRGQVEQLQQLLESSRDAPSTPTKQETASVPTIVDCTKRLITERLRQSRRISKHRQDSKSQAGKSVKSAPTPKVSKKSKKKQKNASLEKSQQPERQTSILDNEVPNDEHDQMQADITARIISALRPNLKDTPIKRVSSTISAASNSSRTHVIHTGPADESSGIEVTRTRGSRSLTRSTKKNDRRRVRILENGESPLAASNCSDNDIRASALPRKSTISSPVPSTPSPIKHVNNGANTTWGNVPPVSPLNIRSRNTSNSSNSGRTPPPISPSNHSRGSNGSSRGATTPTKKMALAARNNNITRIPKTSRRMTGDDNTSTKTSTNKHRKNVDSSNRQHRHHRHNGANKNDSQSSESFPRTISFSGSTTASETSADESNSNRGLLTSMTGAGPLHRRPSFRA